MFICLYIKRRYVVFLFFCYSKVVQVPCPPSRWSAHVAYSGTWSLVKNSLVPSPIRSTSNVLKIFRKRSYGVASRTLPSRVLKVQCLIKGDSICLGYSYLLPTIMVIGDLYNPYMSPSQWTIIFHKTTEQRNKKRFQFRSKFTFTGGHTIRKVISVLDYPDSIVQCCIAFIEWTSTDYGILSNIISFISNDIIWFYSRNWCIITISFECWYFKYLDSPVVRTRGVRYCVQFKVRTAYFEAR